MVFPVDWIFSDQWNTCVLFEHSRKSNVLLCTVFVVHFCGTKLIGQSVQCGEHLVVFRELGTCEIL